MKIKFASILIFFMATTAVSAGPIEDQIRTRQSAYAFLGWNTKKIKDQVVDHPETFNKEQVVAAANAIAAVANADLLSLYGPGTDQGSGWKPTHLKPEYFQKKDEIKEIQAKFIKEADELQTVSKTGDISNIKEQFGKLGVNCKTCHDLIRIRD